MLRTRLLQIRVARCFTKDEGRPLEVGLQEQTSNRVKRRRARALVVSVEGKGGAPLRQVRIKKTNASEPLMTCRNVSRDAKPGPRLLSREAGGGEPVDGPTGVRHEGGVILIQAWVRNVGTCRPDAKGEAQADSIRKGHSTDAGHRDGGARSRVERPVMGPDRRGGVVWRDWVGNPQEEDSRG